MNKSAAIIAARTEAIKQALLDSLDEEQRRAMDKCELSFPGFFTTGSIDIIIEGTIDGHMVRLCKRWLQEVYSGKVDGGDLDRPEAQRLFVKYYPIAKIQDPSHCRWQAEREYIEGRAVKIAVRL